MSFVICNVFFLSGKNADFRKDNVWLSRVAFFLYSFNSIPINYVMFWSLFRRVVGLVF